MKNTEPYVDWQAVLDAPHSLLFAGHTADTVADRKLGAALAPSGEALFTQSNARALVGQAANGSMRLIALPTQVYAAPTGEGEFGLGPGMYHHFDVTMYAGDLTYKIALENSTEVIDLASDDRSNVTHYADHFLPMTRTRVGDLDVALITCAPVAPDAREAALSPAPLPGPAGAFYILQLRNTGDTTVSGKVLLQASDMLVGHYEDADPALRPLRRPSITVRQNTLILTRPDGSVGIRMHEGKWTRLEAPFQAERAFSLEPGAEIAIETRLAIGRSYADVMPVIYQLYLRSAFAWLNLTAAYWRSRLGQIEVDDAGSSEGAALTRDIYIRSLFDNFNCLQTDADGNLIAHWQGAPSHGYGTIWGIDVEPTAVSVMNLCPEIALPVLLFFMTRSRAPKGPKDHSVPILVAPLIIAQQWLQTTGDVVFLEHHPEVVAALQSIIDDLRSLQAPGETLFPTRYSSDGPVGRRYDYATNAKVFAAFNSFAYVLDCLGRSTEAARYAQIALEIAASIERTMIVKGPFGLQYSGGVNLGEDPGSFYLPEGISYYDGEDTSSMLAPVYGLCDLTHEPWINYHRFARSMWCWNYDPEFDVLRWGPGEYGVFDGTAFFSRLGGSVSRTEMREALVTLRQNGVDDATGSVFWWPHGREHRRSLTRCSQGQGAWAWQYTQQWLGVAVDAVSRMLTFAPRGLLTQFHWRGFAAGPNRFDLTWSEGADGATAQVTNHNAVTWTLRVGFRQPGSGADSALAWQERTVMPGESMTLTREQSSVAPHLEIDAMAMHRIEAAEWADSDGVGFRRFGPALIWGHWDADLQWDARVMPLSLRFVVLNATGQDWSDVVVTLTCPDGWRAQGRPPTHWPRPDALQNGAVTLHLGGLAALGRTVAPFWVQKPRGYDIRPSWAGGPIPFHMPSQPGAGVTIHTPDVAVPEECEFMAELSVIAADGSPMRRKLTFPFRIAPADEKTG